MRLLIVTASDTRGFSLAESLSGIHDVTVLHTLQIAFQCPFAEMVIDESAFMNYAFEDYQYVIYIASDQLPCRYLTHILNGLQRASDTRCICVSECGVNLSRRREASTERYICLGFRPSLGDRVSFWETVPVYGDDFLPYEIMQVLSGYKKSNRITFPGGQEDFFEAVHVSDLAAALDAYMAASDACKDVALSVHQQTTMNALGAAFKKMMPQSEIIYHPLPASSNDPGELMIDAFKNTAPSIGAWTPRHQFLDELPAVVRNIEQENAELRLTKHTGKRRLILRACLFFGLFALICVYTGFMQVSSELQFVDFRLLFVIVACLFWGQRYGLAAAVMCSAASVLQNILGGTKWYVIFFHIDNWIPIATYLASAVLFGMYRENHMRDIG